MYLKVRKSDSITSILLFVFNAFLTEKNVIILPLKKIFNILLPFQKNETAIRMGLSRGVKNGLLVNVKKNNEVYYQLTQQAIEALKYWGLTLAAFQQRIPLQQAIWNERWNIVFFTESCPDGLDHALKKLGYGNWNNQMWISPYDLSGEVASLAIKHDSGKLLFQFRGELTGGVKQGDIVAQVWNVKDLNKKYARFIAELESEAGSLDKEAFNGGKVLPFLHQHGLKLFELIQEDPQLPLQLLSPSWQGLNALDRFMSIRTELLHIANRYINGVLS
jgi:phenylacetic acid degradation operon negative regulatory protein